MKTLLAVTALLVSLLLPASAQKAIGDTKNTTDATIYDQVRLRLSNDADVKGGALDVEVKDGVVTVKGRVDQERGRGKIEKLCKKVKGVTKVVNQVQVAK
ncbi:BON domain-containing protein [Bryobacter aggregatus]|uniref:BON domain-containing protein n=1 Tax=Bryobacter aggregatus TaxID=360054 RepID=UPI0004E1F31A|nr:BON domain-containing protein [Bryobacter aggregatus]